MSFNFTDSGYYCIIYDADGKEVKTRTATLTVKSTALAITTQPQSTTVAEGKDAVFSVEVTGGKAPYTFQWYYSNQGDSKYTFVEDAAEWYDRFTVNSNGGKAV